MSNQSIIEHRANMYYVEFREDYLCICASCVYRKPCKDGRKSKSSPYCKALILAILEHWTNNKRGNSEDLYIFMSNQQWYDEMYGMFGRNVIIDSLDELMHDRFVSREPYKMFGRDTFKYLLNDTLINERMRALPERDPQKTRPSSDPVTSKPDVFTNQQDPFTSKRVTSGKVNGSRGKVNGYPFTSNHNIESIIDSSQPLNTGSTEVNENTPTPTFNQSDTLSASADGTRAFVFHPKYDFLALDDVTTPTTLTVFMTYVSDPYWSEIEDKRREAIAMEVWNELATHGHTVVYCWKHEERPVWPVTVESESVLTDEEEPTDGTMAVGSRKITTQQHSVQLDANLSGATPDAQRAANMAHSAVCPSADDVTTQVTSPDEHTSIRLSDSTTRHDTDTYANVSLDQDNPTSDPLNANTGHTDNTLTARNPGVDAVTANDTASQELPIVTAPPAKPARGKKSIDGVPLVMPAGDAKWCAETAVEIIEALKGRRYSETTRAKELNAATKALRVKHTTGQPVTREQFIASWDKMSKWALWKEKDIEPMIRHLLTDDRVIKLCGGCVQQQSLLAPSPVEHASEQARLASNHANARAKIEALKAKKAEEEARQLARKGA